MLAFSDIIDFLLHLLGDDAARAEFERDPQGTLERAGLDGVSAEDIRDARLQLADSGAMCATDDDADPAYRGADAVREIGYTTRHYAVEEHHDGGPSFVDHGGTVVTIDDRDTLFFQSISDDDVTVTDNSVAISDSFNEDNSESTLTAIQANDSFNSDDDLTAIQDNDVVIDVDEQAPQQVDPEPVDPEPVDPEPVSTAGPLDPEPPLDAGDSADDSADDSAADTDPADPDPADTDAADGSDALVG